MRITANKVGALKRAGSGERLNWQYGLLSDRKYTSLTKEKMILLAYRDANWVKGRPSDIVRGDYFAAHKFFDDATPAESDELFDHVQLDFNRKGWARGLVKNVSMRIGKSRVLVMDDHTFALPFVLSMINKGVIRPGSAMLHLDEHSDHFDNERFAPRIYARLRNEQEKFRYIVEHVMISDWQQPLMNEGVIDREKWSWYSIDPEDMWFIKRMPFLGMSRPPERFQANDAIPGFFCSDVVDIDIDILSPLDSRMTAAEKTETEKGFIREFIDRRIKVIAQIASKAKVVTIASSPCYINQTRAIIYIRKLLQYMKDIRG